MPERAWLLGEARFEREAFGRTIQYTDPANWEAPSPCEGWRLKDVLGHVAASEKAAAEVLGDESPAEVDEYRSTLGTERFTVDGWNDWSVARRRDVSPVALAVDWGRAADQLLVRASKITDEEWTEKTIEWTVGEMKAGFLIQYRMCEWWAHGEDIREGGGLAPRIEHSPIFVVNDFAVRLIPYALGLEGKSFPGKSVLVQLEAAGEGTWRGGLAAGFTPSPDTKPDAIITGRAHAFASVAAGRADADVCLYEGLLQVGGDAELGETVLRSLRAYP